MTRYVHLCAGIHRFAQRGKIILRARQNHLIEQFKSKQTALTSELINIVCDSWIAYVRSKVAKGLPDLEKPAEGSEWEAWPQLQSRFQDQDKTWKQECLKRDEKFEMHFSAAVCHDPACLFESPGHETDSDRTDCRTVHIQPYRKAEQV